MIFSRLYLLSFCQSGHQYVMVYLVKNFSNLCPPPFPAFRYVFRPGLERIMRTLSWSVPELEFEKVGLLSLPALGRCLVGPRRSITVGMPNCRSPPPGLGIFISRTGFGSWLPSFSAFTISSLRSNSQGYRL